MEKRESPTERCCFNRQLREVRELATQLSGEEHSRGRNHRGQMSDMARAPGTPGSSGPSDWLGGG